MYLLQNYVVIKIYLANGVILYVDGNQAKRVEKEDEGCDGKKAIFFLGGGVLRLRWWLTFNLLEEEGV